MWVVNEKESTRAMGRVLARGDDGLRLPTDDDEPDDLERFDVEFSPETGRAQVKSEFGAWLTDRYDHIREAEDGDDVAAWAQEDEGSEGDADDEAE